MNNLSESAKKIAVKFPSELGFVNLAALQVSEKLGQLELIDAIGFAHYHHRRDGQTTIYEIAVNRDLQSQGYGRLLFYRVLCSAIENGQKSIFAKCPIDNKSNGFYEHLGFNLERVDPGRKRPLNCWRFSITLPLLFYCGGGGKSRYDQIAKQEGWRLGIRSGFKNVSHEHMAMVDNLFTNYDHSKHLAEVVKSKPLIATAMDLIDPANEQEIFQQAKDLSQHCGRVILIPKYEIKAMPTDFKYWLGYSVPTSHGGTEIAPSWFAGQGRPVHLLGGSPKKQAYFYQSGMNVVSVDANYAMKLAQRYGKSSSQYGEFPQHGTYNALQISLQEQKKYWDTVNDFCQLKIFC